ncbi:MAG: InlB B-repeat-containing protein [Spirochaetaceae bacterium]|jgi:uncharacterized repeat protein (TIGR02543 family)|nr:InlB B-repeat-containing protein [Spirochaetaceae bacterium]
MKKIYGFMMAVLVLGAGFYACDTGALDGTPGNESKGDITYSASADGASGTASSTAIAFAFSGAVAGLVADDVTVTDDTGTVTKGTLSGSGTDWSLGITVVTAGNVKVAITKTGVENTVKDVAVHKAGETTPGTQYTITFDSNGGSPVAAVTEDAGVAVPKPTDPAKSGFVFTGWFSAAEGGSLYAWPLALSADVTVHAHWRADDEPAPAQYTITFDSNGGSPVTAVTADAGTSVSQPTAAPTKSGFAFSGWFSAASGGTACAWPHTLSADITVYAQWTARYTVTFDSNGGSNVAAVTANAGTAVSKPADPAKSGFVFDGWFSAAEGGSFYAWPLALGANVTVYAHWRADSEPAPAQYTITFDSNGGSTVTAVTANGGTSVSQPADPSKNGFIFNGWFDAASKGTVYKWPHTLSADVTMHAQWTATGKLSLKGGFNYGEIPVLKDSTEIAGSFIVAKGTNVTLSVAENAGYNNIKWYIIGQKGPASETNTYTLDPTKFSATKNSVTVTGTSDKDGKLYSRVLEFEITG